MLKKKDVATQRPVDWCIYVRPQKPGQTDPPLPCPSHCGLTSATFPHFQMTTWFAAMGPGGSRELRWAFRASASFASLSFGFLVSSMKGPLRPLAPPPTHTPAHSRDNIPTSCLMTEITASEHSMWLRISCCGWQPESQTARPEISAPTPDQLWDPQNLQPPSFSESESLHLWDGGTDGTWTMWLTDRSVSEWVGVIITIMGGSVLHGSNHPWGFEEPPRKGSTPEGGSGRLGIGSTGDGGVPWGTATHSKDTVVPRGWLAQYGWVRSTHAFDSDRLGFKPWLCHFLATWPEANHFRPVCLSFLICKMERVSTMLLRMWLWGLKRDLWEL